MESKNLIFIKKPILMLASCLVLGFFVLFFSCFESKAEVVVPISGCNDRSCLELPTSSVISNDGSFFLIIDSKTSSSLKKFSHTANGFTANESINLNINNTNLAQLQISLSSDNKKVLIHKPPKGTEKSIVLIVDLNDNSVKRLNTTNLNNQEINAVAFSDSSGNKLILGSNTSNNKSSNLIIINSQDGDIEKAYLYLIQSVHSQYLQTLKVPL